MARTRIAVRMTMALLLCASLGACDAGPSGPSSAPSSPLGPAPPSEGPVPEELRGTWHEVETREKMALGRRVFKFYFRAGSYASGRAVVTGSTISFSGSSDCEGTGTYTWSLDGDSLHFTASNEDPCPRSAVLDGQDWVRIHP